MHGTVLLLQQVLHGRPVSLPKAMNVPSLPPLQEILVEVIAVTLIAFGCVNVTEADTLQPFASVVVTE